MRAHVPLTTLAVATLVILSARGPAPELTASPREGQDTTTLDDQVELSVTVYNSDLALVRDVRTVTLPSGTFDLKFMDIAATINPATVHFRSLTEPPQLAVREQNYEYDLLEPDKLLRKYVGREVTLVRTVQRGGSTAQEEVKARLLSFNNGPVWQIGSEVVTGFHPDHIRFPELPGDLYSRPTLIWTLQNEGAATHRVEAAYLARSLSWGADYVLTVGRDGTAGDLDGWVTLTNNSGTPFKQAKLQLVAGELNRVRQAMDYALAESANARVASAAPPPMTQEAFSEYHLYTLPWKTTIKNAETKQVRMLSGTGVPVLKHYVVNGQHHYYRNRVSPGAPIKDAVQVFYEFRNDEKSRLGLPMPAGVVRVYQSDSKGGVHFVGEDRIGHTPKDETLRLKVGTAFDVVSERKQADFQRIAQNVYEMEYVVTLRNHKDEAIRVEVNEPLSGTWQMLRSSHAHTKTDAWAARFVVPVASGGTADLRYRVRVTY